MSFVLLPIWILLVNAGIWYGPGTTKITGVNKGKTLFIQNPYDSKTGLFCVNEVYVNDQKVSINANSSAIKLDFATFDKFIPLAIKIVHKDSCSPVIINPDAIQFHSVFTFDKVDLTDSTLNWTIKGEQAGGFYQVEKIQNGLWTEEGNYPAKGHFEGASYTHFPVLETGPNKYRIKYAFPNPEEYLYSNEIDFHYYPEPVTFKPAKTDRYIYFSRTSPYKVFDAKGKLVIDGIAKEIDVALLPDGEYVIYFDGKDPGVFTKEYKPK